MLDIVGWLKKLVVSFGGAQAVSDVSGDTITEVLDELNTAVENGGGGGGGGGNTGYTVTFSQDASENWVSDKTVSEILAAIEAGKKPDCIIEFGGDSYAHGTLSCDTSSEGVLVFASSIPFDDIVSSFCFRGIATQGGDVWQPIIGYNAPECDTDDIGKVLGVVSDGEGGAKVDWVTPT